MDTERYVGHITRLMKVESYVIVVTNDKELDTNTNFSLTSFKPGIYETILFWLSTILLA